MVFKSYYPDIEVHSQATVWSFLFDNIPLPDESVAWASYRAPPYAHPNRGFGGFVDALCGSRVPYTELKLKATWLSTTLRRKLQMNPADVCAILSPNTVNYPVALFAVLRIGGIVSCASPHYTVGEVEYALKTAGAKYLFVHENCLGVARTASERVGIPPNRIIVIVNGAGASSSRTNGKLRSYTTIEELLLFGRSYGGWGKMSREDESQVEEFRLPRGKSNGDICGYLSFSSGTTGLPKAVMISHWNVIAQCLQMKELMKYMKTALAVLPFFHITGLIHSLHTPIMFNADVYMLPHFEMRLMLDTIVKYRISELILVPPLLLRLVRDPIVAKYDLSHITEFGSGAAPLSQEIVSQLRQRYPNVEGVRQGYGMTESTSCITLTPRDDVDFDHACTVGKIVGGTAVKIVDPDSGNELGVGQVGEILAKGPQISMGYLNNPSATASTYDRDGFLHTGDLGEITPDGYIIIRDRLKELIKVKGAAVAPAELEDCLLGHPAVEDAAVLGISDPYSGEKPKAYIVLKKNKNNNRNDSNGTTSEAEKVNIDIYSSSEEKYMKKSIYDWVRQRKDRNKWLEGGIEFVNELPKSPSGKILRKQLKEMENERGKDNNDITSRNKHVKSRL